MIAFFTVCYCVTIWLFYIKMKIKPTPKNVAVSVVVGVLAIGLIVVFWRFSAPSSGSLVVSRYTVQIVPQVRGPITKIHAEANVPLKKGEDLLFEIQKEPYKYTVDQLAASLNAARNNVDQLHAGVRGAAAALKKSMASLAAAKAEMDVARGIEKSDPSAIARLKVKQVTEQYNAALAGVDQAEAGEEQAKASLASTKIRSSA